MAGMDGKPSRIRDVDRNLKILRDIPSKLYPMFDAFTSEANRDLDGLRHHLGNDHHRVGRDFPRTTMDGVATGFTLSVDEIDSGFYSYKENEDPFHGFYHRNGELIVKFKINLPVFDGFWHTEDLMSWIDAIEDFFEEICPPEHLKCKIVSYKMKGAAYYWWKQLQDDRSKHGKEEIILWPTMRKYLISRFAPSNCSTKVHSESKGNNRNRTTDLRNYGTPEVNPNKCVMEYPILSSKETSKDEGQIEKATNTIVITYLKSKPEQRTFLAGSRVLNFEFDQTPMEESQMESFINCSTPTIKNYIAMLSKRAEQIEHDKVTPGAFPSSLINHRSFMEEFVGSYVAQRCKFVKVGAVRNKKTQFWVLPSLSEDYSRMVVILFDPGGNTYYLSNWSFKKSQLSCSIRLTGSVIGNILASILENPTVDFGKMIRDQLEEDITGDRVVGVENEATVIVMVLHKTSQARNTFSAPNDVLRLGTYDVDLLVNKIPMFSFDPGGVLLSPMVDSIHHLISSDGINLDNIGAYPGLTLVLMEIGILEIYAKFGHTGKCEEAYQIIKSIPVEPNSVILVHEVNELGMGSIDLKSFEIDESNCFLNLTIQPLWYRNEFLLRSLLENVHVRDDPCDVCSLLVILTAPTGNLINVNVEVLGALFDCRHKSITSSLQVRDACSNACEHVGVIRATLTALSIVMDFIITTLRLYDSIATRKRVKLFVHSSHDMSVQIVIDVGLGLWKMVVALSCYTAIQELQCSSTMNTPYGFTVDSNLTRGRVISWEGWNDENDSKMERNPTEFCDAFKLKPAFRTMVTIQVPFVKMEMLAPRDYIGLHIGYVQNRIEFKETKYITVEMSLEVHQIGKNDEVLATPEGWHDGNKFHIEGLFIMFKLNIAAVVPYSLHVVILKLFRKMVNGLDPPMDAMMNLGGFDEDFYKRSWTNIDSFRSSRLAAFQGLLCSADLTTYQALEDAPSKQEQLEDEFVILGRDGDDAV